jgi:preprotein translocase subunit Sec63
MSSACEKMKMHREYMKKYQQQAANFPPESVRYKDLYATLGVPRDSTHAEIRQAYRSLALRYHPDRNSSKEAEERWVGVPAAYAILSNPNDRCKTLKCENL